MESDDDDDQAALEFSNFSTCSPRYSRMCGSPSPLASSPVSPVSTGFDDLKSNEKTIRRTFSESSNSPPTIRRRSNTESRIASFQDRYAMVEKLLFCRLIISVSKVPIERNQRTYFKTSSDQTFGNIMLQIS